MCVALASRGGRSSLSLSLAASRGKAVAVKLQAARRPSFVDAGGQADEQRATLRIERTSHEF